MEPSRDRISPQHAVPGGSSDHVVPIKTYAIICGILLFLTFLTWRIALVDLGPFNVVVAVVIACVKATLVVLFFMHAFYAPRRTRMVILRSKQLLQRRRPSLAERLKRPQPLEELMFAVLKVMADHKLDAIVHKTVEHQPTLIKDGINPPY